MAKVIGIGGVFVKAAGLDELRAWYRQVLGFEVNDWGGATFPPLAQGVQVWGTFPADTDYFAPSAREFMVNLVVHDLDGILAQAAQAGVQPLKRDDTDPNGRFAWLLDPMGVKIELWQPKG